MLLLTACFVMCLDASIRAFGDESTSLSLASVAVVFLAGNASGLRGADPRWCRRGRGDPDGRSDRRRPPQGGRRPRRAPLPAADPVDSGAAGLAVLQPPDAEGRPVEDPARAWSPPRGRGTSYGSRPERPTGYDRRMGACPHPFRPRAAVLTATALLLSSVMTGVQRRFRLRGRGPVGPEAELEGLSRTVRVGGRRRGPVTAAGWRRLAVRHHEGAPGLGRAEGRHDRARADPGEGRRRCEQAHRVPDLQLRRPRRLGSQRAPLVRRGLRDAAHALRPGELRPSRSRPQRRACGARTTNSSTCTSSRTRRPTTPPNAPNCWTTPEVQRGLREALQRMLPHVRTTDAARDMDLMRQVLGDDKLHYFGISYGTELGGVYAHLFPKKVGRAVFDGVVDPTQNPEQGSSGRPRASSSRSTTSPRTAPRKPRTARSATLRRTSRTGSPSSSRTSTRSRSRASSRAN